MGCCGRGLLPSVPLPAAPLWIPAFAGMTNSPSYPRTRVSRAKQSTPTAHPFGFFCSLQTYVRWFILPIQLSEELT